VAADSQLETDIEPGRVTMEAILTSWGSSAARLSSDVSLEPFIVEAKMNLRATQTYVDKISLAVNALKPTSTLAQTTIDTYQSDVLAARTNIATEIASVAGSEEKLRNAESKLALKRAGSSAEERAVADAPRDRSTASGAGTKSLTAG